MAKQIKMLKTVPASQDGRIVEKFKKGRVYEVGKDISEDLASIFLAGYEGLENVCELIKDVGMQRKSNMEGEEGVITVEDVIIEPVKTEEDRGEKMENSPENKMETKADENKGKKEDKKKKLEELKKREKAGFGNKIKRGR